MSFLHQGENERHLLMFCFHGILRSDFSLNLERKRTHGLNANIVRKSLTLIDFLKSHITESWQTMKILYESLGWLSQWLWCWMMKFELIMFFFNITNINSFDLILQHFLVLLDIEHYCKKYVISFLIIKNVSLVSAPFYLFLFGRLWFYLLRTWFIIIKENEHIL